MGNRGRARRRPVPFLFYQQRRRRVTEVLDDAARWADRDHLVQGRRRVTFTAMIAAADRVARYLSARGLGPGDRLLLLARNSPEWVISLWSGLRLGAVVAPGNRWWNTDEIARAIELTEPAVIVADTEMTRLLPASAGPDPVTVVPVADIRAVQDEPPSALPVVQGSEDDPALIIFTAGTTGLPKAAVLAHRSVIANLQNLLVLSKRLPHQLSGDRSPEVIMQSGPLFHIGGVQSLLLAMLGGNTIVFLEGRFDSGQVLDLIERERVSIWGAVPTMAIRVLEDPTLPGRDLAAVRSISLGGSPVTPELSDRLRAAFPAVRRGVSTVYGMTEAGGTVAAASGALMAEHPQTAGRPMPVVEMRIGQPDETGTGEIIVRTPSQMLGYWGEDAPEIIDADGWLHTGDVGRIEDGLLYVTGPRQGRHHPGRGEHRRSSRRAGAAPAPRGRGRRRRRAARRRPGRDRRRHRPAARRRDRRRAHRLRRGPARPLPGSGPVAAAGRAAADDRHRQDRQARTPRRLAHRAPGRTRQKGPHPMTDPAPPGPVVDWTAEGSAFLVQLANPPANQLGRSLLDGLTAAVDTFEASAARTLIVHSQLDGFFAAGADIKFMAGADRSAFEAYGAELRAVLDRIAGLDRPFGAMSRPALSAVLRCVDDAAERPLAEGMAREAARVTDLFDSPDGREGLAAFIAKRPASFA